MPPFRRVDCARAGPTALGILVPPGARTLVVLRPRALEWDLVALGEGDTFCDFGRDEAAGVARRVLRALEQGAGSWESRPAGEGSRVLVRLAGLVWVACRRVPGQPYRAAEFATAEAAAEALARLTALLCPAEDAGQEYYFNTQNFSR